MRTSAAVVSFAIGVAWFLLCFGVEPLSPLAVEWLQDGDWAWHHLGWVWYRRDGWHWPLGFVANYPDPVGSSIGYSDAVPWLALALKALTGWLHTDYQFFGPWLALCFGVQGVFGAAITATATPRALLQALGGGLFAAAPVLAFRTPHVALCTQWLLLALLLLHVQPPHRRAAWLAALLVVVAAGVQPYLLTMCAALALSLWARLTLAGVLQKREAIAFAGGTAAVAVTALWTLGFFDGTGMGTRGFGTYSADLLALVNSGGLSRLFPGLPLAEGQYEGYGFLGTGVLALAVIAAGTAGYERLRRRRLTLPPPPTTRFRRDLLPLAAVCVALATWACSTRLRLGGHEIARVPISLGPIERAFPSTGRFVWPLHYALLTLVVLSIVRRLGRSPLLVAALLGSALVVQIAENRSPERTLGELPLHVPGDPNWEALRGRWPKLVLHPPWIGDGADGFTRDDVVRLGWVAARLRMTINVAALARLDRRRLAAYAQAQERALATGRLDPQALYVVHPAAAASPSFAGRTPIAVVDGFHLYATAAN